MDLGMLIRDEDLIAEINEVIDTHLDENDPEITKKTLKRLVKEGYTDVQARELVGHCVAYELTSGKGFDLRRYTLHLSYLPYIGFEW
jgi:hypothetical protein